MFRGESAASPAFMTAGAWIQYAQQFNAMLFQIEHRYYGSSYPTRYTVVFLCKNLI